MGDVNGLGEIVNVTNIRFVALPATVWTSCRAVSCKDLKDLKLLLLGASCVFANGKLEMNSLVETERKIPDQDVSDIIHFSSHRPALLQADA